MTFRPHDQRWFAVRNNSGQTIPPFAAMQIGSTPIFTEEFRPFAGYPGGKACFHVDNNDSNGERWQDPNWIMFNSDTPIEPGRFGLGTQDYPTRARIRFDRQEGPQFQWSSGVEFYGPVAGKWELANGGNAFELFDVENKRQSDGRPGKLGQVDSESQTGDPKVWIGWVRPIGIRAKKPNCILTGGGAVAVGKYCPLRLAGGFGQLDEGDFFSDQVGTVLGSFGEYGDDFGIVVHAPGIYLFGFNCLMSNSDPASVNTFLALQVMLDDSPFHVMSCVNNGGYVSLLDKTVIGGVQAVSTTSIVAISKAGTVIRLLNAGVYPNNVSALSGWFMEQF